MCALPDLPQPPPCGAPGEPCCDPAVLLPRCYPGADCFVRTAAVCEVCGGEGQQCCPLRLGAIRCGVDLFCNLSNGVCEKATAMCAELGEVCGTTGPVVRPCCEGTTCAERSHTCVPAACMERDCPCDISEDPETVCGGTLTCAPAGAKAGTCQPYYEVVLSWTGGRDLDLMYRDEVGGRDIGAASIPTSASAPVFSGDAVRGCGGSAANEAIMWRRAGNSNPRLLVGSQPAGSDKDCEVAMSLKIFIYGEEVGAEYSRTFRSGHTFRMLRFATSPERAGFLS
eukprot:jgi/Ulvmu1/8786/UM048_0041.1